MPSYFCDSRNLHTKVLQTKVYITEIDLQLSHNTLPFCAVISKAVFTVKRKKNRKFINAHPLIIDISQEKKSHWIFSECIAITIHLAKKLRLSYLCYK